MNRFSRLFGRKPREVGTGQSQAGEHPGLQDPRAKDSAADTAGEPAREPESSNTDEIVRLLAELEAVTYVRRLDAAAALGKLGDQAALPALERMSNGTSDLWVLFDDGMRARARIAYPSGVIPGVDQEMLWGQLRGTNDRLKRAAEAAITQIKDAPGAEKPEGEDPVAARVQAAMKVFDDAYLVRGNPELDEAVAKALDAVHASQNGLTRLLDRLCEGVIISDGHIQLAHWGDMAWNELLKKREIVRCLQRAKDGGATGTLRELLQAECSYGQWLEIVRPALSEAVDAIEATSSES